jgi:threonine-phosphate decarboxylase
MRMHGGDVWQVAEELGIEVSELLDFSANINPRGLPPRAAERLVHYAANPRLLGLYPDPFARRLRMVLSRKLGVPSEAIVVGPGAEALLNPALRGNPVRRALAPIPAFSEYRRVCAQEEIEFVPFPLDRAKCFRLPVDDVCRSIAGGRFGVIFLNNPHNPSGALLDSSEVRRILEAARATRTLVLLDEAFIDYVPHATLACDAAARPGLVVIRSLTKFYGCPALRAGYLIAHPDTARRIASFLPAWPVTQLAIDTFAEAVEDREYAEGTLRDNTMERETLTQLLQGLGLVVFPSAANYLLFELTPGMSAASALRRRMIRRKILVRSCDSFEGLAPGRYVRVAVRSASENLRLIQALSEELGER